MEVVVRLGEFIGGHGASSLVDAVVLGVIRSLWNSRALVGGSGRWYPGSVRVAEVAGVSPKMIRDSVVRLRDGGVVRMDGRQPVPVECVGETRLLERVERSSGSDALVREFLGAFVEVVGERYILAPGDARMLVDMAKRNPKIDIRGTMAWLKKGGFTISVRSVLKNLNAVNQAGVVVANPMELDVEGFKRELREIEDERSSRRCSVQGPPEMPVDGSMSRR